MKEQWGWRTSQRLIGQHESCLFAIHFCAQFTVGNEKVFSIFQYKKVEKGGHKKFSVEFDLSGSINGTLLKNKKSKEARKLEGFFFENIALDSRACLSKIFEIKLNC